MRERNINESELIILRCFVFLEKDNPSVDKCADIADKFLSLDKESLDLDIEFIKQNIQRFIIELKADNSIFLVSIVNRIHELKSMPPTSDHKLVYFQKALSSIKVEYDHSPSYITLSNSISQTISIT